MKIEALRIKVGEPVMHQGKRCSITALLSSSRCLVKPDEGDALPRPASLYELGVVPKSPDDPAEVDTSGVDPKLVEVAHQRFKLIEPIVRGLLGASVDAITKGGGVSRATLFRWLRAYRETGLVLSLIPDFNARGGPLKPRILPAVDEIVTQTTQEIYLTNQESPLVELEEAIRARCKAAGLEPPCYGTIRNRVRALEQRMVTRRRQGRKEADKFRVLRGSLPGAERPLDIVHIDHTRLDITLVDRETRKPIGRPTITVAEDAATRMIVGFCLSWESPKWMSVALCLAQAILPKDKWLSKHHLEGEWPVWGVPRTIHVDNAKEFRGNAIKQAAKELGFNIHYRRAGHPEDGGRIERLIGTINREVHRLPGTTRSNPKQLREYDSEGNAVFTLDELEAYIADWIINVYHLRPHRGLQGSWPLKAWEDLRHGTKDLPGFEPPPMPKREEDVRLPLLPFQKRCANRHSISLFGIQYRQPHLQQMVFKSAAESPKSRRKYLVKFDPRDMRYVWVLDHFSGQYVEFPYLDTSKRPRSLYEEKAAKKAKQQGKKDHPHQERMDAARKRLNDRKETSKAATKAATKAARRERERIERGHEAVARERSDAGKPEMVIPAPVAPAKSVPARTDGTRRFSAADLAFKVHNGNHTNAKP